MNRYRLLPLLCSLLLASCQDDPDRFRPGFEVYTLLPAEGLGDRSFNDAVYEGVELARNELDFRITYVIPDNLEEGLSWIGRIPGLEPAVATPILVIIAGNQFVESVEALNGVYKHANILLLAGAATPHEGLASVTYRHFAPSYLAGFLSTVKIPGCRARVIAAFDAPFLKAFRAGFEQGVADAGGQVQDPAFLSGGLEGFSMPDSAYRLTKSLLPDTDLIFGLGDGSNFGIINAARDYGEPRYVIGIDSDQSWMGLSVVTGSVVIRYGQEIGDCIRAFAEGNFESGHFERTMESGKTLFQPNPLVLGPAPVPDTLIRIALKKEQEYYQTLLFQ